MSETSSATPNVPATPPRSGRRVMAGDAFDLRVIEPVDRQLVVGGQRPPHGRFLEDHVRLLRRGARYGAGEKGENQGKSRKHSSSLQRSSSLCGEACVISRGGKVRPRHLPDKAYAGKCMSGGPLASGRIRHRDGFDLSIGEAAHHIRAPFATSGASRRRESTLNNRCCDRPYEKTKSFSQSPHCGGVSRRRRRSIRPIRRMSALSRRAGEPRAGRRQPGCRSGAGGRAPRSGGSSAITARSAANAARSVSCREPRRRNAARSPSASVSSKRTSRGCPPNPAMPAASRFAAASSWAPSSRPAR